MKKMILFLCAFLLCQVYGAKEKIFEISYNPQDFVKFFDSRLENYWRIAETNGKNIDGEFLAIRQVLAEVLHGFNLLASVDLFHIL